MNGKYKMTGCARFLIFLVFLIPIAYFGSKYLRDSGTWDKIKDKVESSESNSVERTIENKRERIDIPASVPENNSELADQFGRLREAYEEQELVLATQDQEIKDLQAENAALRDKLNEIPARTQTNPTPTRNNDTRSTTSSGSPSLDDLLQEADNNLGTSSNTGSTDNSNNSGVRTTLGSWSYSFSGSRGVIEFYQQNGKLFSRTTVQGSTALDIDELERSGDRFTVRNSPDGEYYVLRRNGDLDAYARNGFQVTCLRR